MGVEFVEEWLFVCDTYEGDIYILHRLVTLKMIAYFHKVCIIEIRDNGLIVTQIKVTIDWLYKRESETKTGRKQKWKKKNFFLKIYWQKTLFCTLQNTTLRNIVRWKIRGIDK